VTTRSRILGLAAAALAAGLLAGCTSSTKGHAELGNGSPVAGGSTTTAPSSSSSAAAPDAVIHMTRSVTNYSPGTPVTVTVEGGTLTSVQLFNSAEQKVVSGSFGATKTSWTSTEDLGYGKSYTLSADAVNADGVAVHQTASISTVTPPNMTMPYLNTIAGQSLQNGATYGVGIIPVVHFDEPITDRAAAERTLSVTVTPPGANPQPITGVWNWVDDQNVHWRSEHWLPAHSKVTVTAKVYGVQVSPGLWGQADQSVSFTIGDAHVAYADDATHMVNVYFNGKLVRQMPTSMGRGGYVTGDHGQQIPLWTMPGTYTVITHENPAIMSSDSYGLPANSPAGYAPEKVYWSTKITVDGIYLHELDATVWAQGHSDLSHGCLNLNYDNAKWYYQNSLVGDIVEVINVHSVDGQKSAPVALWQGGDWTVPWSTWVQGSALPH
jgi:lipoprotein-anchoring transpeptidase ErfK/SrfK